MSLILCSTDPCSEHNRHTSKLSSAFRVSVGWEGDRRGVCVCFSVCVCVCVRFSVCVWCRSKCRLLKYGSYKVSHAHSGLFDVRHEGCVLTSWGIFMAGVRPAVTNNARLCRYLSPELWAEIKRHRNARYFHYYFVNTSCCSYIIYTHAPACTSPVSCLHRFYF